MRPFLLVPALTAKARDNAGNTSELTSTSAITSLTRRAECGNGSVDAIELLATGGTSMRYDTSGSQFVFTWPTPAAPGAARDGPAATV